MIKKFIIKHKFWFLLALIFIVLRLPSLFEPYWYGDEGIYLALGQGIRKGLVLYSQIHDNKPPTLYYLAAFFQTVFGFRFLLLVWMIPTLYFFWKLSFHFLSKGRKLAFVVFLILTSIPFVEGNIANAEIFMLLPTIAGFLIVLNSKKMLSFFYAGLCLGLALTIKIPVFIEFVFLVLWLYFENKKDIGLLKKIAYLSLGFIFPLFLFGIYFYFIGAFPDFFSAAILQNFGYLSSWAKGVHTASIGQGGLFLRGLFLLVFLVCTYFLLVKKIISKNFSFVLFWFGFAIFAALLSGRPYPHYLIQVLPPLSLLVSFLFEKERAKYLTILFLLVFFLIIKKYNFYFYRVFSYYENFYSYVIFLKKQPSYLNFFGSNVENNLKIAQFIKKNSKTGDNIFVWGDEPYIYTMSNRLSVTKYIVAYHIVDFNGYKNTMDNLEMFLPKFIIYYKMNNRPFVELDNFINLYYSPDKVFDSVIIYKANETN